MKEYRDFIEFTEIVVSKLEHDIESKYTLYYYVANNAKIGYFFIYKPFNMK